MSRSFQIYIAVPFVTKPRLLFHWQVDDIWYFHLWVIPQWSQGLHSPKIRCLWALAFSAPQAYTTWILVMMPVYRPICQCTFSVYFSTILLTISSTQAAVPCIPMQNLWPVLTREGSSTVAVLKGIYYMLDNRFFKSFWRSDRGRCFYFVYFNISRNAYKIVLQQNSKKLTLYIFGLTACTGLKLLHFSLRSVLKHSW